MPSACTKLATLPLIQAIASAYAGRSGSMHSTGANYALRYRGDLQQHHSAVAQGCGPGCLATGGCLQDSQERPQV